MEMNSRWELAETYHLLNQKKYNGKEWVNDMNLGQLLYGKRPYNPILCRFESTDPISHMFPSLSGYNYASNNPIRNIDLHGLQGVDAVAGALVGDDNKGYIKTASKTLREDSPRLAGLQDAAFAILDFIGFNHIDNVYFGDQPTTTAEKVAAVVPVLFNTKGTVDEGVKSSVKTPIKSSGSPNPYGAKGKPDHQMKVKELEIKAVNENPDSRILTEKKIQVEGSNRRPDVQAVDPVTGKTTKIYEAERKPNSKRNISREKEYEKLKIANETHKVGG